MLADGLMPAEGVVLAGGLMPTEGVVVLGGGVAALVAGAAAGPGGDVLMASPLLGRGQPPQVSGSLSGFEPPPE